MPLRWLISTLAVALSLVASTRVVLGAQLGTAAAEVNKELQLERDKLQLELRKIEIEEGKLEEQQKAALLTLLAVTVTALGVLGTVAYNIRNANYQARVQAKLKALEVVTSAAGPKAAKHRLAIVKNLLGAELIDQELADDFLAHGMGQGHDQNRKDLIKMLLDFPGSRNEVLRLWRIAFENTSFEKCIDAMQKSMASADGPQGGQPSASSATSLAVKIGPG